MQSTSVYLGLLCWVDRFKILLKVRLENVYSGFVDEVQLDGLWG